MSKEIKDTCQIIGGYLSEVDQKVNWTEVDNILFNSCGFIGKNVLPLAISSKILTEKEYENTIKPRAEELTNQFIKELRKRDNKTAS